MDFAIPPLLQNLRDRCDSFVREQVIPYERDPRRQSHGPSEELKLELNARAREAGLLSPHVGRSWGGLGLDHRGKALVFEAAGYSMLGPVALNCAAPDEGNMHLLEAVATPAQKERYLRPLAAAAVRSCFCMTEPQPGAGSDPALLSTRAVQEGEDYVIEGRKWLITGAEGAAFAIIMARSFAGEEERGATLFLAPMDSPGIEIVRRLDTLDQSFTGGHAEIRFKGLRLPGSAVLGEVGQGFRHAQLRLAPARLTHCMRWLGAARRAHDIAVDYAGKRQAFGQPLSRHEGVGFMLADNLIDMESSRLMIWHTAWLLDQGESAGRASSIAKVHCSEAIWRVVDRSLQVLGGLGITGDTEVQRIFRDVRAFRIYDGPSEVHRWSIARSLFPKEARA